MAKPEWGTKRVCQSCGTRFYDLMRTPCVCPKCQAVVETELVFKPRRQSAETRAAKLPPVAAALGGSIEIESEELEALEADDVEVVVVEADDEEDALIEDVADLGEDDDDMAEVMEHLDEDMQGEV